MRFPNSSQTDRLRLTPLIDIAFLVLIFFMALPLKRLDHKLSTHLPKRVGDRIFRSFTRPFLHRPLFLDQPVFANFLLFARLMLRTREFPLFEDGSLIPDAIVDEIKAVSDRLTVAHRWQRGDLLMLDNSRFLHGRNPVAKLEEREIWTQFGYANFLDDNDPRLAEPWRYTDDALSIFFGPRALDLRPRGPGRAPSTAPA